MRLTVTVPDPVADEARRLAADAGLSVSAVVADALARHVAAERRRRAADRVGALVGTGGVAPDADDILRQMRRESDRDLT